jgi:CBS domain containing-hemolysin-like protein
LILTTLAMIVGELVPKSLALQDPTRVAMWTVIPMQWFERVFAWSIDLLNGSGNVILWLLRIRTTGHRHVHSPDEIELLIATAGCSSRKSRSACIRRSVSDCGPHDN